MGQHHLHRRISFHGHGLKLLHSALRFNLVWFLHSDSLLLGKRKLLLAYQGCERGVATFYDLPGIPLSVLHHQVLADLFHDIQAEFGPTPVPPGALAEVAAAVIHEQIVEDEFVEDTGGEGHQLSETLALRRIGPTERPDPVAGRS